MPRPPAKRGRVAGHKAAQGQAHTSHTGNNNGPPGVGGLTVEIQRGDVFGSGALGWNDSKQRTRDTSSSSIMKTGNITSAATSFANSSTRVTKNYNHETPRRTDRASRENGSSGQPPATAPRPGTRGHQPLGSAIRRGDASSKIQRMATPGFDSSMLSSFRRRPRQPSILHLMNDDDDDDEGEDRGSSDLDSEAFLGEFDPDDESTPLNFSKRTALPVDALPPTPSPRKNAAALMPPPSRAKKRKLLAVEMPTSPRGETEDGDAAANNDLSEDSENNSIALPELPERNMSAEAFSQTIMAPPVSSSVAGSPAKEHPLHDEPNRRPPLQPRPTTNKEAHVSTAALRQNLLPVRRRRRAVSKHPIGADVFDAVSDEDVDARGAADEDELSRVPSRSKRGTSGRKALRSNKHGVNKRVVDRNAPQAHHRARARSKHHRGRAPGNEKQTSAKAKVKKNQLSRPTKGHITYARRSSQGKENETYAVPESSSSDTDHDAHDAQDTTSPSAQRQAYRRVVSAELIEQAKKFAEVDRWPLEFEDVMWEPNSSFR